MTAHHPYAAELTLDCDDETHALALHGALAPETADADGRLQARVRRDGERVILNLEARDASTLRAAVNSHLRWIRAATDVADLVEPRHPKTS